MKIKKLKINKPLGKYKAGAVVKVRCTDDGIPEDVYWRRRLKDSNIDQCVEWVKNKPATKNSNKGEKS
jgi:hypothetical protein